MNKRTVATSLIGLYSLGLFADTNSNLVINEIQVANIDCFIDPSYNYGGWIELYNSGSQKVNLAGMKVRHIDSNNLVDIHTLTADHGSVAAKGYACLWFDHNSQDGYYGTNANKQIRYKLDIDGGTIELIDADNSVICSVSYPAAIARCSYLRQTDGGVDWAYTSEPTPKATNNNTTFATQRLEAPVIDTESKVFSTAFSFKVTIPEHTKLYYTTDGSTPISGKSKTSQDGIFTIKETSVYRFLLAREGYLNSQVITRSFIHNTEGYYLPIVSISTHPDNLFDNTIGVYVRGTNGRIANDSGTKANQNMDWERPVNFEYLVPNQNNEYSIKINQEVTLKIFGGYSRFLGGNEDWDTRSSFKLKAEKQYEGINELSYPFFASKPHIKQKSILVRNGGQDQRGRLRDAGVQEIIRTSGLYIDTQAWQPTHVFLNGKYLGALNLREESNKRYAYSNYGIDTEEIDQWEGDVTINEGDANQLNKWFDLCNQLAKKPTDETIWQKIENLIDIDEFCNYMAVESYIGNRDWFHSGKFKNIKGFCSRNDNGKIHFVLFDTDGNFGDTDLITQILETGTSKIAKAFINMLKYKPFKKQFIDTYCLINGSIFEKSRTETILDAMAGITENAMQMEGGSSKFTASVLKARIGDVTTRRPNLKNSLKKTFNLPEEYNIKLTSTNTDHHHFLLNGQEIPTGKFDGYMFAPIVLTSIAPTGFQFESWKVDGKVFSTDSILKFSDLKDAGNYTITAQFRAIDNTKKAPVLINEVSAGNDIFVNEYWKKADFIELYNTTSKDIDLEGCYLSDNINKPQKYKITSGNQKVNTIIPAYGYKIVWCDKKDTESQLHADFKLENTNDAYISITATDGSWSDFLEYKSQDRWYTFGCYPDGSDFVGLLRRSSIENENYICTDTELNFSTQTQITSYQLSINEAEWATICLPFSFAIPPNLQVYTVERIIEENNCLSLQSVTTTIDNKPYLINGLAGKYTLTGTYVKGDNTQTNYLINGLLNGTLTDKYAPIDSYVLQNHSNQVGFYHVDQDNTIVVSAYHAFLRASDDKKSIIKIHDNTSVLDNMCNSGENLQIYNQLGHPVRSFRTSGLYIIYSFDKIPQKIFIH